MFNLQSNAQNPCELYKKAIDTILIRQNTVEVHADGSPSPLIDPTSDSIDSAKTVSAVFPASIYIDNKAFDVSSKVAKPLFYELTKVDISKFNYDKNERIIDCNFIGSKFVFKINSDKNNSNIDWKKPDTAIINSEIYYLNKQRVSFSKLVYSKKGNRAALLVNFKSGFGRGYQSTWAIIFQKKVYDKRIIWVIEKLSGRPH